jgi:serine/threonine protein kinase
MPKTLMEISACMDFKPFKIGKYLLMEKLATGGMAEVYRANARGAGGFEKQLAIKRILPNYAQNDEFRRMFEYEARLSSLLGHANIVQIYDFEKAGNDYLLAMEYVNGKNLRQFVNKARKANIPIPVEFSVFVVNEVSKGLDYAHHKKDEVSGRPLNVIHRDMSPQNIMISYEGAVKIVDFGIAKAKDRVDETRSGVIKGKFSYMSPEQANGEAVDHRSDIFSTGIILYELLTGRRLFTADNDLATLKMIQECVVKKPSTLNPKIPADLEKILLKILTKDIKLRYQSAGLLNQHLQEFMNRNYSAYSARDVSLLLNKVFAQEIVDEKKRFESLRQQSIPFSQGMPTNKPEADDLSAIEDILEGTATKSEHRGTTGVTSGTTLRGQAEQDEEDSKNDPSIRLESEKQQAARGKKQPAEPTRLKTSHSSEVSIPTEGRSVTEGSHTAPGVGSKGSVSTQASINAADDASIDSNIEDPDKPQSAEGTFTPTPIASRRSVPTEAKTQSTIPATKQISPTQTFQKSEFVYNPERQETGATGPTNPTDTTPKSGVEYAATPYSEQIPMDEGSREVNPLSRMLEQDLSRERNQYEKNKSRTMVSFGSIVALGALTYYLYTYLNSEKVQTVIEMLSPRTLTQAPDVEKPPSSDEVAKQKGAPGAPAECLMLVDSDPRGAAIFIDGKDRGSTSTNLVLPCEKSFDIKIVLRGFDSASDSLYTQKKSGSYFRKLNKIPIAFLELEPRRNIQLYIDNEFVQELDASSRLVLEVRANKEHIIRMKNDVFGINVVRKVYLEEGKKELIRLEDNLPRRNQPR